MAHDLSAQDLKNILDFTIRLARSAGSIILEGSDVILSVVTDVGEKKNSVDLVTEWDVKVENQVMKEIKDAYPSFNFMGEESYSAGKREPLTDEPTFCVDPIDGTTNFVHGFPFVCISLGLIYKKRPVLGVIYNPFLDHLYTGITGQGSFLHKNGKTHKLPLYPAKPFPSLSTALLAVEWGSDRGSHAISAKSNSFARLAGDGAPGPNQVTGGKMAHSLRSVGSAALNFSLVAQGALDMYWEVGCWPWDVCAGAVIAQEAGALVSGGPSCAHDGDVTEEVLTGRRYIVIRAIADSASEKGTDAQKRLIKEYYETVEDMAPN